MEKWRVYIREAITEYALRCCADFEISKATDDTSGVFFSLHHLLVHIANVDKVLSPRSGSERAALLVGRIDISGVDLKPFRRLRNHLGHFDERLDKWVADCDDHPFFDRNIVTGARGFPAKSYLRALDGNVFKFYGEDYPLESLHNVLGALLARLRAVGANDG